MWGDAGNVIGLNGDTMVFFNNQILSNMIWSENDGNLHHIPSSGLVFPTKMTIVLLCCIILYLCNHSVYYTLYIMPLYSVYYIIY